MERLNYKRIKQLTKSVEVTVRGRDNRGSSGSIAPEVVEFRNSPEIKVSSM